MHYLEEMTKIKLQYPAIHQEGIFNVLENRKHRIIVE